MKHVFVVNPSAGRRSAEAQVRAALIPHEGRYDCEVYVTGERGDAQRYVRAYCRQHAGELRFYACGGDGTLHEVVNGAYGFPQAAVGAYASGSGNDYVKYHGERAKFLDIGSLLDGTERKVDLMRVDGSVAVNMVHFGLDSKVTSIMEKVRRIPLIGGRNAYLSGIVGALLQPMFTNVQVWADGEQMPVERLLLGTIACGRYVGGGFQAAPRSRNDDGLMDVCLVKPISRLRFLRFSGVYRAGRHLEEEGLRDVLLWRRAARVHLKAKGGILLCLDGELLHLPEATVDILPGAMRFILPRSLQPMDEQEEIRDAIA